MRRTYTFGGVVFGSKKFSTCHVDHHRPTFRAIVTDFDPRGWELVDIVSDDGVGLRFADQDYAERFAAFHRQHAHLRITTPEANQKAAYYPDGDSE